MAEKDDILGLVRPLLTLGKFIMFKSKWLAWNDPQEGASQSKEVEPPPDPALPLETNIVTCRSIIAATAPGRRLLRDCSRRMLTVLERQTVMDLLVNHFFNNDLHLSNKIARQLNQQVGDIFPEEDVVIIIRLITLCNVFNNG